MQKAVGGDTLIEELCINTIRFLSVDGVEKANSGHPGLPLEAAPIAHLLWTQFLKYNPKNPKWINRDRFVLSAGHGSMLLYSMLYLTGYDVTSEDLKKFRQWGSKTPGHPEYTDTPGVEVTTGPLGQGFANAVGMGIAQRFLAEKFNKPNFPIIDYSVYAICSDGDMMEGISHEAASLAGHLKLGNLVYIYLNNHVSLDGNTQLSYSDDVQKRFEGYHWHVQEVDDGNNLHLMGRALENAKQAVHQPSLIVARTHLGYGSPNKQDTAAAHGSPLGKEEVKLTKENLGWPLTPEFYVPDEVSKHYATMKEHGKKLEETWNALFLRYTEAYPDLAKQFQDFVAHKLPPDWKKGLPTFTPKDGPLATRQASGKTINGIAPHLPFLFGGSADLETSNETRMKEDKDFLPGIEHGRNLRFGVREHGMAGALNGIALTGGFIPYGATFFNFLDYLKPSLRLAALMKLRVIYVFTHDSVGLGEDGPTHQPIEQLATLRATPNVLVLRPADANETVVAWRIAVEHRNGPVALVLSRQKLPVFDRTKVASVENVEKGAYILADSEGVPDVILLASGSEVSLAMEAREKLQNKNVKTRVVSFPSYDLFVKQPKDYREKVLPSSVKKRIAIEAASPFGWREFVGEEGSILAIDHYGASAPAEEIFKQFGFTSDNVVSMVERIGVKK